MRPAQDTSKLPKWAQTHIETLQRDVAHYKGLLDEVVKGDSASVFMDSTFRREGRVPLAHERVVFAFDEHTEIQLRWEETRSGRELMAMASNGRLVVHPSASNVVGLKVREL